MKHLFCLPLLLLGSGLLFGQNTLRGIVFLYKEKGGNVPISDVYIKAPYGGSVTTKSDGHYDLSFDNQFTVVSLSARKKGYEIINGEELQALDLTKKKQQNIYLDEEGNTEKRRRELLDAAVGQARKTRERYYAILDGGGSKAEALQRTLEEEAGKKFDTRDEVRTYLYSKYGADIRTLESVVNAIVTQNLDHTNREIERIKKYTVTGQLDSAVLLLNFEQSRQKIDLNNTRIQLFREDNAREGDKYLAAIPLLLNNRLFGKIDSSYQMYVRSDTTDNDRYYRYAYFLQNQNKLKKADSVYIVLLKKLPPYNFQMRASVLNNQGFISGALMKYDSSLIKYKEALLIREKLSELMPDGYLSGYAQTATNIGALEHTLGFQDSAILYLEKALATFQSLEAKDSGTYLRYEAGVCNDLATTYASLGKFDAALNLYNKAIALYQQLMSAEGKSDWYRGEIALSYNSLSVLYATLENSEEAERYAQYSLDQYRILAEENPEMYQPYYAGVLSNMANFRRNRGEYDTAIVYYERSIVITKELMNKNPEAYRIALADELNNYGLLLTDLHDDTEAENKLREAVDIYTGQAVQYQGTNGLNTSLYNLATLLKRQGRTDALRMKLEDVRKALYPIALKDSGAAFDFTIKLNNNLYKLAADRNDTAGMLRYTLNTIELCERVVSQNEESQYGLDLTKSYSIAGTLHFREGNLPLAAEDYKKAIKGYIRLSGRDCQFYETELQTTITNFGALAKQVPNDLGEPDELGMAMKVFLFIQQQKPESSDKYKKLVQTSAALAKRYMMPCVKDSIFKYYSIAFSYSDSMLAYLTRTRYAGTNAALVYCFYYGDASWYALHMGRYAVARDYAVKALQYDSSQHWVETNLAHGMLFLGDFNQAKRIYLRLKTLPYERDNSQLYSKILLQDFQDLTCSVPVSGKIKADINKIRSMLQK